MGGPALSLDPGFGRLGREIARFAHHTERQLRASVRFRAELLEAEAWSDGQIAVSTSPADPRAALAALERFARLYARPAPELLGAYFAHHHLRGQAELSRELLRAALAGEERAGRFRRVLGRAEAERQAWVGGLLERTLLAAAPELGPADYAALNVGALTDHEDVDLAILAASPASLAALSRAFSVVSRTFVRFASKIQLFLAEQLGTGHAGALLEEYHALVTRQTVHVASSTQLLGAQLLAGSPGLLAALGERVTRAYYAGQGEPGVHAGFLRAVMGELAHLISPASLRGPLTPKREIYVPAKLVIAAVRVIHGVHEPSPPEALRALALADPGQADTYQRLEAAFVENEVLRALIFLYVAKGEELDLADEAARAAAARVAVLLGLGRRGRGVAAERLLSAYNKLRGQALQAIAVLALDIARHLGRVSRFRALVEQGPAKDDDLAPGLLATLEREERGVFWEEVVELLGSSPEVGLRFLGSFHRRGAAEGRALARGYLVRLAADPRALVELLVLLASIETRAPPAGSGRSLAVAATGDLSDGTARLFFAELLLLLEEQPALAARIVARLDEQHQAELLHRLASAFGPRELSRLADLLERAEPRAAAERVARTVRSASILVHQASHALTRVAGRVVARTPEFLERVADPRRLKELWLELLADAGREPAPGPRRELLGDAFDVALLRAALVAALEADPAGRDLELSQAVDRYVQDLLRSAEEELARERPAGLPPHTGFVLYVTGGFGRYEAFGADWDYLAVVDEAEPGLERWLGRALQRVSSALARRGLMPHNRLTDSLGAYAVSLPALAAHLSHRTGETFIDEAEVLEARFLAGDPAVHRRFQQEIFAAVVGERRSSFVRDLLLELADRRLRPPRALNLKLGPGGLREIHLTGLLVRLQAGLPGPFGPAALPQAAAAFPGLERELAVLLSGQAELRRARDLYRLLVATDDHFEAGRMMQVAAELAPLARAGFGDGLAGRLASLMQSVAIAVDLVTARVAAAGASEKREVPTPTPSS